MDKLTFREFLNEAPMTGQDLTKHGMKYLKAVLKDVVEGKPVLMKDKVSYPITVTSEIEDLAKQVNGNRDPTPLFYDGKRLKKIFTSGEKSFSWTEIEKTVYSIGLKDGNALTHLKPSLFLGSKERFSSAQELKNDLINGIDKSDKISEGLKKTLTNLVNAVSNNSDRIDLDFEAKTYIDMVNKDFGEALGPLKIMSDPKYMPWIPRKSVEIYIPKKSNYALADYVIYDTSAEIPVPYKISAKVIKGVGNTVKITDIMDILENAEKSASEASLLSRMRGNGKFRTLFSVLDGIQGKKDMKFGSLSAFAGLYGAAEMNATFKKAVEYFSSIGLKNVTLKDLETLLINDDNLKNDFKNNLSRYVSGDVVNFNYVADVLVAANSFLKIETRTGSLKSPLKLLINLALSNQIFYAKFGLDSKGKIHWDVRGGSRIKGYKFETGGKEFGLVYLDDKAGNGSRNRIGRDTIGLRVEELARGTDVLPT